MVCNKCGQAVPVGSRFCNSCGAAVVAAAAVAEREPELQNGVAQTSLGRLADEHVIFCIRPTMIYVAAWYAFAVLVVVAFAALMGLLSSQWPQWATSAVAFYVLLGIGLIVFSIPVYKHILRRREVYTLTNHKLEMRYGILSKTVRNIPLRNIQDVTVTASAMQRIMRIGDIEIESASEAGQILLNEVPTPDRYAGMILTELRRRN